MKRLAIGAALTAILGGTVLGGDHWPQWRGPSLDGTSDSTGLPVSWSETEGVKWKVKLPSWSGSTPAIWGDRIFVPSASAFAADAAAKNVKEMGGKRIPEGRDLLLLCLSKKDGSELWRSTLQGANHQIGKQNMSTPSPVTDGAMVWWLTGTGVLTALTVEGKEVWRVDLQKKYGKFGLNWGFGSSPLLYEGKVIVPVLHGMTTDDPSYVVAFEAKTGEVAWRVERPTDAQNESPDAYTTVVPMKVGGAMQLLVGGGDYVTGHDPKDGKELWRCGGLNPAEANPKDPSKGPQTNGWFRMVTSPAVAGDVVLGCIKSKVVVACKAGGQTAWTSSDVTYDVPTPVTDGTHVYILNDRASLYCVDPKTGKPIYKQRLPGGGTYSASPLLADGKIYMTNEKGLTVVVAAGPEFKVLAQNPLDDPYTLSSIAVSGSQLFLRTSQALYCIGK